MVAESQVKTLRPEVKIEDNGTETSIAFAHWQVSVPSDAIRKDGALLNLVRRRRLELASVNEQAHGLYALLDAQGCFLPNRPERLTSRAVLRMFQPIRSQLYAQYYAHPLWTRLRSGEASRGELTAWMIHNYHISRSAGVIAARMAATTRNPDLREFFREDALEEYWHCDAFYFVKQSGIELSPDDAKSYVPLPASTAFEDHALRAAEEDTLGHLLIAYFQESSIIFRQDSERFYNAIEEQYRLPGAFKGWRKHMTLDLDHDHAGALEARFDDETEISLESARTSLRTVQLAQFFLLNALDQITEHASVDNAISLRRPATMTGTPRSRAHEPIKLRRASAAYLISALRDAAFRALALARTHDQIIAAGRLATQLEPVAEKAFDVMGPWHIASRNFLVERAAEPETITTLAPQLIELIATACPELRDLIDPSILVGRSSGEVKAQRDVPYCRLRELINLAADEKDLVNFVLV